MWHPTTTPWRTKNATGIALSAVRRVFSWRSNVIGRSGTMIHDLKRYIIFSWLLYLGIILTNFVYYLVASHQDPVGGVTSYYLVLLSSSCELCHFRFHFVRGSATDDSSEVEGSATNRSLKTRRDDAMPIVGILEG